MHRLEYFEGCSDTETLRLAKPLPLDDDLPVDETTCPHNFNPVRNKIPTTELGPPTRKVVERDQMPRAVLPPLARHTTQPQLPAKSTPLPQFLSPMSTHFNEVL